MQLKNKDEGEWGEATEENPESCLRGVAERERVRERETGLELVIREERRLLRLLLLLFSHTDGRPAC